MSEGGTAPLRRVLAGLAIALILAGTAIVAANRAERLTMEHVVGVYRMESTDPGSATDRMLFQRFTPDGYTRLELVQLRDTPGGLESSVSIGEGRGQTWTVEDGQLCVGGPARPSCSKVARDPLTGDLTVGEQRLTRLRSGALID